jgi:drug/metabolite transporter (DMT)-like permease
LHTFGAAFFWGTSNFLYSNLDTQGEFAVTCLSWTGFVGTAVGYKAYKICTDKRGVNGDVIRDVMFKDIVNRKNLAHQAFRTANWFLYIWLTIIIGDYAKRAAINPGIIYACLSSTIIFNTFFAAWFFEEKLSLKISVGIAVVIGGVVWITIAKNADKPVSILEEGHLMTFSPEEIFHNRLMGILIAVLTALLSSMRPVQARIVKLKYNYHPFDFTVDSGLVTGGLLFPFWLYYWLGSHPAYTLMNAIYSLFASTLLMFWGLLGLYASVNGPQGPTSAIMQVHAIFSIAMAAIFQGYIPNIQQSLASLTILVGVILIIFYK